MSAVASWWDRPRRIDVLVDNPSWILPFAEELVEACRRNGDTARLVRSIDETREGEVLFLLGCTHLVPADVRALYHRSLVIHESNLPEGRGFSPLTWLTLAGETEIPICLLEAEDEADSGAVIFRDRMVFAGNELNPEMRAAQGQKSVELALRFLDAPTPPVGEPQSGTPTVFPRRRPEDSRLDPDLSLAEQFDLLRVVDNERYPAFFELRGRRYLLKIEPDPGNR